MRNPPKRGGRPSGLPVQEIDRSSALARLSTEPVQPDPGAMRQEIESLRTEVKQLRATVEMLLSMVVDVDRAGDPAHHDNHEENPPFYN